MTVLAHSLERTVFIRATRDTVFRFFTDSARWAAWWGAGSTIDAQRGGAVFIRLPGGVEVIGEVLEVAAPERVSFSYGFAGGTPIPPGGSRVTIQLEAQDDGTRVVLTHEFADPAARDSFVQGWRYQLSLFSNVVSREITASAADIVDAWLAIWDTTDAGRRADVLARIASADLRYHDRFSAIEGATDLVPHIDAFQQNVPGLRFERSGPVRECQGYALADWVASGPDGQQRGHGTTGFVFGSDGRIASAVTFWS